MARCTWKGDTTPVALGLGKGAAELPGGHRGPGSPTGEMGGGWSRLYRGGLRTSLCLQEGPEDAATEAFICIREPRGSETQVVLPDRCPWAGVPDSDF